MIAAATADTTAPTAPSHLGVSESATQITLLWGMSTDDVGVTGYRVERCRGAGCTNFAEIGTSAGIAYVDSALASGTTYRYRVRATDAAGNLSPYSGAVSATTSDSSQAPPGTPGPSADSQAPRAPGNLTATASGTQITLRWSAATDNVGVTRYIVQRCLGAGCTAFARIAAIGVVTTFVNSGLAEGTTYQYRVRARDAAGNFGLFSRVASATTQRSGVPPPPSGSLSPRAVALTFTQTQQFTTSLSGATWSVDGVVGGSDVVGTISFNGLYSPPSAVGKHTVKATAGTQSATATAYVTNYAGNFTHHNDNGRTGQNLNETVLTPANVAFTTFGKRFSYDLDGQAYASPLYVANVNVPGHGFRNIVYVATEHNTVYAFDADRKSAPLWQVSFIDPAAEITTVPFDEAQDVNIDIDPEIGITGTPVIDRASGTLYVVAKTKEMTSGTVRYVQRLHALDIATGRVNGSVAIQASVQGIGDGSNGGGRVPFDPLLENQRAALLLSGGVVYIAFASHGDASPWHGWVLGYNAQLQQVMVFNSTPNGGGGGVWQGGGGLAADSAGDIYFATGNGSFDVNQGGFDYGDSFVKLSPAGQVLDFFTPHDQATLDAGDIDLGSGGLILVPDQGDTTRPLMIEAGKGGTVYLVDRSNLGHYRTNNDDQIVQSFAFSANFSTPVYYEGSVYFGPVSDSIKAFSLSGGQLSPFPTSQSTESYQFPGATLAISARGASNGILWAIQRNGSSESGVLRAYDAGNLHTLYSSDEAGSRDSLNDPAARFSVPVVANGKVFVGSMSQLTIYGFLP